MTYEEIEIMMNKYFDGELEKGSEPLLFTQLSLNEDAREYFKTMNVLKETIKNDTKEFPMQLEEHIMFSLQNNLSKASRFNFWKNPAALVSYGFAVVVLIFTFVFYSQSYQYKSELEKTQLQINHQGEMINLLINSSLPAAEVEYKLKGQIVVEGEKLENKSVKQISL